MDAEFFSFENCSEFTQGQLTVVVLTRGITAAICCAALLIVLGVLGIVAIPAKRKICGTVAKRLTIWLTAATVPYQLVLVLHLESYILSRNIKSCKAYGFLVQYFGSVQLLLTLGISASLVGKGLILLTRCTQGVITDPNHTLLTYTNSCSYATQD